MLRKNKLIKQLALLTFFTNLIFPLTAQKDTLRSSALSEKVVYDVNLINNPQYNNFFVLINGDVGIMDYMFNLKYLEKAKYTSETLKVIYKDKLLFFKYKYDGNNRLFGYYITKIATQNEVLDTLIPFVETTFKEEKKYIDKKTQQIIMRVLPAPSNNKVAVVYDQNYKDGVNEGFKYQLLDENGNVSEVKQIFFSFLDITSKITWYSFDGENIYCLVNHYKEKHTKKNNPISYSIVKHNIANNKITMSKKFDCSVGTKIHPIDFYWHENKLFIFNAFLKISDLKYSLEELKLLRLDEDLLIEDSITIPKTYLDELSVQNNLTKDNFYGFQVAQKINPSTKNGFPDYLLNYQYSFLKADWKTYSHLLITSAGGIPQFGSKKRFDCTTSNMLIYNNGIEIRTFNDTIIGVQQDIVNYIMTKGKNGITLNYNSFNKSEKQSKNGKINFEKNLIQRTYFDSPIIRTTKKINLKNGDYIYPIIDDKENYLIKVNNK